MTTLGVAQRRTIDLFHDRYLDPTARAHFAGDLARSLSRLAAGPLLETLATASAVEAAIDYCLASPLRTEIEVRMSGDVDPHVEAVAAAFRRRSGAGPVYAKLRTHVISAAE